MLNGSHVVQKLGQVMGYIEHVVLRSQLSTSQEWTYLMETSNKER